MNHWICKESFTC